MIEDSIQNEEGVFKINTEVKLPKMYIGVAYIDNFLSYAAKKFLEEEIVKDEE